MTAELERLIKAEIGFKGIAPQCSNCKHNALRNDGSGGNKTICDLFQSTIGVMNLVKITGVCSKHSPIQSIT
jgi:hypothetical protein